MLWAAVAKFCSISRMMASTAFSRAGCLRLGRVRGISSRSRSQQERGPTRTAPRVGRIHRSNGNGKEKTYADSTLFAKESHGDVRREQNRNRRGWSLRRADVRKQVHRESHA